MSQLYNVFKNKDYLYKELVYFYIGQKHYNKNKDEKRPQIRSQWEKRQIDYKIKRERERERQKKRETESERDRETERERE